MSTVPESQEPFELIRKIGANGLYELYEARVVDEAMRDDLGCDTVALKLPVSPAGERVLKRQIDRIACRVRDAGGALPGRSRGYLGFEIYRNSIALIFEWMDGGTLRDRLPAAAGKPLPIHDALEIAGQLLEELEIIHARGMTHGRIRPDNIFFSGNRVRVDLCFSGWEEEDPEYDRFEMILYAPPEAMHGGKISPATDLWAAGVVLFEMLTGNFPFGGRRGSLAQMVDDLLSGLEVSAAASNAAVPPEVDAVVSRALAADPARRYPTAAEMRRDIAAIQRRAP